MPMRKLLDKLDRKYGRYGIENLMMYIVGAMAIVYFMDYALYDTLEASLNSVLIFNRAAIFRGELWRLVTFVFTATGSHPFLLAFTLYFYWLSGRGLEAQWGTFKFNVFYFTGLISSLIFGLIIGYATNYYINMSLFLAFAILYPNYEILLFFFLPVKVKYLAVFDAVMLVASFIFADWRGRVALIIALANLILFFGPDLIDKIKYAKRRHDYQKKVNK